MSKVYVGTSSWKYPSWEGIVYSTAKKINYLEEYARSFDTVEVDAWFWSLFGEALRLPSSSEVAAMSAAVPEEFRFTVKLPNSLSLTHHQGVTPLTVNNHLEGCAPLTVEKIRASLGALVPGLAPSHVSPGSSISRIFDNKETLW